MKAAFQFTLLSLILAMTLFGATGLVRASICSAAGNTGLTALVVANSNQIITGMLSASGCDVGVYVGPGVEGVVIANATITGANDHGILVQDTSNVVIENSLITMNGVASHICATPRSTNCIVDDKEVELIGTQHSTVKGNTVTFNSADGGIAVSDDGPLNPGALNPGTLRPSSENVVMNNVISNNIGGCDILVAAFDQGAGATGNVVTGNVALGSAPNTGGYVGQIVVAANGNNTSVTNTTITGNVIDGSLLPGIVVHSNAPGDVISSTLIENNILRNNGVYPSSFATPHTPTAANGTTGIAIMAEAYPGMPTPPTLTGTSIISNVVVGDKNGVWMCNAADTTILQLEGNSTVLSCNAPMSTGTTAMSESSMTTTSGTSSTSTAIPGFPLESILLGSALGLATLVFLRRRNQRHSSPT
jgi:hypothetical protein